VEIKFAGGQDEAAALTVEPDRVRAVKLYVSMPAAPDAEGPWEIEFTLKDAKGRAVVERGVFVPGGRVR
jgi:hypothetical protein